MVVEYEKDYLEELYNQGKCTNKKYRFQKPVVAKYQKRIDTLMAATRIEDLFVFNSLNFEALANGFYSIRIDFHYRLEFKIRQEGTEPVVTICTVTDITNHYQERNDEQNDDTSRRCFERRVGGKGNFSEEILGSAVRALYATQRNTERQTSGDYRFRPYDGSCSRYKS